MAEASATWTDPRTWRFRDKVTAAALNTDVRDNLLYLMKGRVQDVRGHGAVGDGVADDTAAIQSAIDAADPNGTVVLPDGFTFVWTGTLDLADARNVKFRSSGNAGTGTSPVMRYTGTADPAMNLASSQGVSFEGVVIEYTNTSFTGTLIKTDHSAEALDPAYLTIDRCWIGGQDSSTTSAAYLLDLNRAIICTLKDTGFWNADRHIIGRNGSYSNVIHIERCAFNNSVQYPIHNPGEAWTFLANTFEPRVGGEAGAVSHDAGVLARGLSYIGNWHGDVTTAGANWVSIDVLGLFVASNTFGTALGTGAAVKLFSTSQGISIVGNRIDTDVGLHVPTATVRGVLWAGNDSQATTTIEGRDNITRLTVLSDSSTPNSLNEGMAVSGSMNSGQQDDTSLSGVIAGVTSKAPSAGKLCTIGYLGAGLGNVGAGSLVLWPRNDIATRSVALFGSQDTVPSVEVSGGQKVGFFGVSPVTRPELTYSRGSETTAEQQIRQALGSLGLIKDSTTT